MKHPRIEQQNIEVDKKNEEYENSARSLDEFCKYVSAESENEALEEIDTRCNIEGFYSENFVADYRLRDDEEEDMAESKQEQLKRIFTEIKGQLKKAESIAIVKEAPGFLLLKAKFPFFLFRQVSDRLDEEKSTDGIVEIEITYLGYEILIKQILPKGKGSRESCKIPNWGQEQNMLAEAKNIAASEEDIISYLAREKVGHRTAIMIYNALCESYAAMLLNEMALTEKIVSLRDLFEKIKDYPRDSLVKECILQATNNLGEDEQQTLRRFAKNYGNYAISALEKEIAKLQAAGAESDMKRYNTHRTIEKIGYKFLFGKSKFDVAHDIDLACDTVSGKKWPIIGDLYCTAKTGEGGYRQTNEYIIEFGMGEGYTMGTHGYGGRPDTPAKDPQYESFVHPGNNIDDDRNLAMAIIKEIDVKYPLVKSINSICVTGSFHEQFQYRTLRISADSIFNTCKSTGKSEEEILKDIFLIIKKHVLDARAKNGMKS